MIKTVVAFGLCLSTAAAQVGPAFAGTATALAADYAACQTTSEAEFRTAVLAVTTAALVKGTSSIDYRAAVGDEWRRLDVSRTIDTEVDKAFAAVKDETSWGSLIQSLGSEDKARELTLALTERVYRSNAMKKAIEDLATGVGRGLGSRIEIATSDAAGPALECLQAFLGPRYGATVANIVAGTADREFTVATESTGEITAGGVLSQTAGGMTGAAILVMRRQIGKLAGRIGQRLVGSILSRLVSVVAGGIGLVLIAKDVWDLRYGVLPIVASELKSADSKAKVQDELAVAIGDQIRDHVAEIARHASDRIVEIWKEYRAAHAMVLDLAEKEAEFRSFLDRLRPEALPRVDEVTALVLAAEGEMAVMRRLHDGTLDEAVNRLPEPAMDIARQTRSLETALAWNAVAGARIDQVLTYEIFRRAKPSDFTRQSLDRIVSLSDPVAVKRLAAVPPQTRDALFDLDPAVLVSAARNLDEARLETLAAYLNGLAPAPRQRLLERLAASPGELGDLTEPRIRDAVLASKDQGAAIDILLRPADADTPDMLRRDVRLALDRQIHPWILWHKHPILILLAGLAVVIVLLLFRRLFYRPQRRGRSDVTDVSRTG